MSKVDFIGNVEPKILIDQQVWKEIKYIISISGNDEVGWLSLVKDMGNCRYLLEEIHLVKQEVNATESDMDGEAIADLYNELLDTDEGMDKADRIRCWCHVHPGASTHPSPQDEKEILNIGEDSDFFIRGILSKTEGHAKFDVYYFKLGNLPFGMKIEDVEWEVWMGELSEERQKELAAEMKEKVIKKSIPTTTYYNDNYKRGTQYAKPAASAATSKALPEDDEEELIPLDENFENINWVDDHGNEYDYDDDPNANAVDAIHATDCSTRPAPTPPPPAKTKKAKATTATNDLPPLSKTKAITPATTNNGNKPIKVEVL